MCYYFIVGDSMKNAFVTTSINYLIRNNACNEKQINIFRYTLESLYSLITKTSIVLLLSFILKTSSITLIILLLYSLFRGFAFGIHATKNIYCWLITILVYTCGPLFIKYYTLPISVIYLSYGLGILALLLWSPSDTPARPLIHRKKRIANKIISLLLAFIYITIAIFIKNDNFNEIISFIFILETICICPLTYMLFKIPYRNYKNYKK